MGIERGTKVERFESDFDLDLYNPDLHGLSDLVETHVRAFFGEKLLMPRVEKLWVGQDGTLDPDYVEMMKRSVDYWRSKGDEQAATRFEKELEGAENAVKLILSSRTGNDEPLPVVINASDPGNFYVDQNGRKKSVTFVWMLSESSNGGWKYNVYSLPTSFIGLDKHWELLKKMADLQSTESVLKRLLNDSELTSNELVAFPVILDSLSHTLNEIATELGYASWNEIEEMAENQLAMEEDSYASERREQIVVDFMARIFYAVKDRRPREYQQALVAAMSDTMAVEAGKRDYLKMKAEDVKGEIDKNVRLALALQYKVFEKKDYQEVIDLGIDFGSLSALYVHQGWLRNVFTSNPLAAEARATGCGGSGINYSEQFGWNISGKYDFGVSYANMSPLFEQQREFVKSNVSIDTTESSGGDEPEGRYSEGIYKPGHCRACNKDREKVWHKEDGGCDCCTICERRLAGGD